MAGAARFGFASALVAIVACRSAPLPPAHVPLTTGDVVALAAAHDHTCALMRDGKVACWGSSPAHELRDANNVVLFPRPTIIDGLPRVVSIASGDGRVCAIDGSSGLWCWGDNAHGAILPGEPVTAQFTKPVRIDFVKNVRTVTASAYQTCALEAEGRVVCWGQKKEIDGQLFVAEDDEPVELAGGRYHHCARLRHGEVTCWGAPSMGLLGDDDADGRRARARISDVVRIAIWGMRTCAWLVDGSTACWGQDGGHSAPLPEPRTLDAIGFAGESGCRWNANGKVLCGRDVVANLDAIVQVVAGGNHRCALSRSGEVSCWGGNHHGQLGDESRFAKTKAHVAITSHAQALAMSAAATCVALDDGRTRCWGGNSPAATLPLDAITLGTSQRICGRSPSGIVRCMDRNGHYSADVSDTGSVRSFVFDGASMLGVRDDGTIASWPYTEQDWYRNLELAKSKIAPAYPPQSAKTLKGVENIVALATTTNGALYVVDRTGAILRSTCRTRCDLKTALVNPEKLPFEHASTVAAEVMLACALTNDGGVACWAENPANKPGAVYVPQRVALPSPASAIATGQAHACALLRDGRVSCWGRGDYGEMGDGLLRPMNDPTIVPNVEHVVEIAATGHETCARTKDARVLCWGGFDVMESHEPVRVHLR